MLVLVVLSHLGTRKRRELRHQGSKPHRFETTETKRNCKKETEVEKLGQAETGRGRRADKQTHRFVLAGFLWKAVNDRIGAGLDGGQAGGSAGRNGLCCELWGHTKKVGGSASLQGRSFWDLENMDKPEFLGA